MWGPRVRCKGENEGRIVGVLRPAESSVVRALFLSALNVKQSQARQNKKPLGKKKKECFGWAAADAI